VNNDFAEIQKIYEGYGGQYTPIMVAGQQAAQQGDPSYGKGRLPTAYPGAGSSGYARGVAGAYQVPTAVVLSGDEEVSVKDIENQLVLDKIDEHIERALEDEMMYAVHSLGQLKEYVKSL
jgi:hypothetical protein